MYLVLPGCISTNTISIIAQCHNDAHYKYKSDCILLAIFREMLNKSYFKLLAYVPTLPRLLVLHKTLLRFLWNNSKYYRNPRPLLSRVGCTNDAGFALTTSRGTRQVARASFTAKSYRFVSIFSYLYRCIVSYTKYRDAPIYRCIVSPLVVTKPVHPLSSDRYIPLSPPLPYHVPIRHWQTNSESF